MSVEIGVIFSLHFTLFEDFIMKHSAKSLTLKKFREIFPSVPAHPAAVDAATPRSRWPCDRRAR